MACRARRYKRTRPDASIGGVALLQLGDKRRSNLVGILAGPTHRLGPPFFEFRSSIPPGLDVIFAGHDDLVPLASSDLRAALVFGVLPAASHAFHPVVGAMRVDHRLLGL